MCLKRLLRISWRKCILNFGVTIYVLLLIYALFNRNSRVRYNMPDFHIRPIDSSSCSADTTKLGLTYVDLAENLSIQKLNTLNSRVSAGGKWKPKNCQALQKVAIIVPYRDRYDHLLVMLKRIHSLLRKQDIQYQVFVIEQAGIGKFNRGRLLNAGVNEALKSDSFDCLIFHDVDLVPEHDGNMYMCDDQLRHLASAIDEMRYHVMYSNYAGGVSAINRENFYRVNGFSNDYWGWGSEDDDFSARTMEAGLLLTRPPEHIGRFKMVRHYKQWRSDNGYDLFLTWRSRWKTDGINNIASKYSVLSKELYHLYTNVTVDLGEPPSKPLNTDGLPRESLWWFLTFFFP